MSDDPLETPVEPELTFAEDIKEFGIWLSTAPPRLLVAIHKTFGVRRPSAKVGRDVPGGIIHIFDA